MKFTYDWLCEYLKTDMSAQQIADTLTRTGLEVEDLTEPVAPVAAKIVACEALPGSDHLHILQVDDGTTTRQVVCGAPNARVGLISALARPGCVIAGHEIKSGKLRGVLSDGMMCSGKELGINDDHSGIIELPDDTVIGTDVISMSSVFDAGITPNRPDYLAVRGVALDLAACGAGEYIAPENMVAPAPCGTRKVDIQTDKCPVYSFCEIHGIKMAPSAEKIARRLAAIGINPKNAPVDATNYICYDMGQPMHCFDADEINGDIIVRMAADGEEFTDLFGNTHVLRATDMVIADASGILALAGIVGGARGMSTDKTKNIILESAYFDPVAVRKTAKRLGISTDASYRYERGIDPTITGNALGAAVKIITDACGGEIVGAGASVKSEYDAPKIQYNPDIFKQKTGLEMAEETQKEILQKLGFDVVARGNKWTITPRAARVDVVIAENIVSELIRIYGYEKITPTARVCAPVAADDIPDDGTRRILISRGLNEVVSFGFANSQTQSLLIDMAPVKIANPITAQLDLARGTLISNMMDIVADNEKRGYADLALFEIGTVFDGDTPGAQRTAACIVRTGMTMPRHWTRRARPWDVYDVQADLRAILGGRKVTISSDNAPLWAHPFRYGAFYQGKQKIAEFGELHPMVAKKLKIKTNVVIAYVADVTLLPETPHKAKEPKLSDLQPITRDFAFITDADFQAEKLVAAVRGADARITDVTVFDAFDMGDGKKSVAVTTTLQPTDNMLDTDLQKFQDAVIAAAASKCGAVIRDK